MSRLTLTIIVSLHVSWKCIRFVQNRSIILLWFNIVSNQLVYNNVLLCNVIRLRCIFVNIT